LSGTDGDMDQIRAQLTLAPENGKLYANDVSTNTIATPDMEMVPGDYLTWGPSGATFNVTYVPNPALPFKRSFDYFFFRLTDNISFSSEFLVEIKMVAVNAAPVIVVTNPIHTATSGQQISVAAKIVVTDSNDIPQLAACTQSVTVSSNKDGLLSFSSNVANVVFSGGSSSDSIRTGLSQWTFDGLPEDVSAALSSLLYTGNREYAGVEIITIDVNDNGNTGIGGALSASATITVAVSSPSKSNHASVDIIPIALGAGFGALLLIGFAYYRLRRSKEMTDFQHAFLDDPKEAFGGGQSNVVENPLYGPQLYSNPMYEA